MTDLITTLVHQGVTGKLAANTIQRLRDLEIESIEIVELVNAVVKLAAEQARSKADDGTAHYADGEDIAREIETLRLRI